MTTPNGVKWEAEDRRVRQQAEAGAKLDGFGGNVWYPFDGWAQLAGMIQSGEVDFLAAASGQGKTTAVRSIIERTVTERVGVVYGGFEMAPRAHRVGFAAMLAGLDPGDVLGGDWNSWEPVIHEDARGRVRAKLKALENPPWDALHITEHPHVTVKAVQEMGELGLALEKDYPQGVLCIVDHVDHLGGAGGDSYKSSVAVTAAIHDHATKYGTRWLVTTQVHNRTAGAGGDRFWRHRDIPIAALKNGQHKEEVATRIFGLYRPLKSDVTPDELKAVVDSRAELSTVLAQGVSCVTCLKHRHHGHRVGQRVLVGWDKGRLVDLPTADALAEQARQHGIRSNTNYVSG